MKKKRTRKKTTRKVRKKSTTRTSRAKLERKLGHMLLTGRIPVIPPSQLPRCPIPPTHVKEFADVCKAYEKGEMSEAEVIAKVNESLRSLKKPEWRAQEPEERREGSSEDASQTEAS